MAANPNNPFGVTPPSSPPAFPWKQAWNWNDVAKARADASAWTPSRSTEKAYERQLRSVSGQIKSVLASSASGSLADAEKLLRDYAELIEPWARQSAANMMAGVNRKNVQAWSNAAKRAGLDMRALLNSPGVGAVTQARIAENAGKIRSLVIGAADDVAKLVQESMVTGTRAEDLAARIAKVGEVSEARARTIARTEVSKAGTALTQARADSVGSTGYIWRTARDGDTRDSHAAMEGVFVPWDKPPTLDGMTGHAGEFPNCRCYPEPVIPKSGGGAASASGVYKPALPTRAQEQNAGEKRLFTQWEKEPGSTVIPHVAEQPLANVAAAVFDQRKLTSYALDRSHPAGGPKARRFEQLLGIKKEHAGLLEKQVMAWLEHAPAVRKMADKNGERFNVYVPITGPNGKTVDVMTAWIYDRKHNAISAKPRLINCFIDDKGQRE